MTQKLHLFATLKFTYSGISNRFLYSGESIASILPKATLRRRVTSKTYLSKCNRVQPSSSFLAFNCSGVEWREVLGKTI